MTRPKGLGFTRAARRRANLIAHQRGEQLRCFWCKRPMRYRDSTGDHVIPRRLGGKDGRNIVASCERCNLFRAVELHLLFGEQSRADGLLRKLGVA